MREVLVRLGPAFVKIGQALSSRPDVMDPEYLVELEQLQDRIPPFPDTEAYKVLEEDLGRPVRDVFVELSPSPIAAASLGQVYRGKLSSAAAAQLGVDLQTDTPSGYVEVAVKVQRPGVAEAIALDAYILRLLAGVLRTARNVNTDLPSLVDEWASSLFRELDYNTEAENGIKFAQMYGHLPKVYVPRMYAPLTTTRVLVMEWINGRRLKSEELAVLGGSWRGTAEEMAGVELELVEVGVQCSLEQMLGEGFYHADPHPGNLLRTEGGKLAYLDFGMMGQVEPETRAALIRATLHLVNREYPSLANDLVDLGLLPVGSDRSEIIPAITGVFEEALKGGVSNLSFGALSANLGTTMYRYKFRIPPFYTLLVRSLTVLEGIALSYDPNYKVLGAAYPWVARRLLSGTDPLLEDTLQQLLYKDNQFQFTSLESLMKQALRSPPRALRLAAAAEGNGAGQQHQQQQQPGGMEEMLQRLLPLPLPSIGGLAAPGCCGFPALPLPFPFPQPPQPPTPAGGPSSFPSSSSATPHGAPSPGQNGNAERRSNTAVQLLLTMEGRAVRRILVDEVAAGLDAAWRVSADNWLASLPLLNLSDGGLGLSESGDRQQLEGLGRLARALSAGANQAAQNGAASPAQQQQQQQRWWSMQQSAAILNWLIEEVGAVPPSQRQDAMVLVREIAQQLASRITARTLRSVFGLSQLPAQ